MATAAAKLEAMYQAARGRVEAAGLEVVGVGATKDGRRLWCVPSQRDQNHWHVVTLSADGNWLQCDCEASRHGRYCCHRAAARMRIEADREAQYQEAMAMAKRTAAIVEQLGEDVDRTSAQIAHLGRLAQDTRAISIWK